MANHLPTILKTILPANTGALSPGPLTVSAIINQFTTWLEKPGNYPRLARQFLEYCLTNKLPINGGSLQLYAAGKKANQISPVRKFLLFYQIQGSPVIVAEEARKHISPAANELILGYLADATHLRGEKTKENYTQALNAFFSYIDVAQQAGRLASFSAQTVGNYVNELRDRELSAFTINFNLSAIKQLAQWVIKQRKRLGLTDDQVDNLRDINTIRGLTIERGFYKDSLEETERDTLLHSIKNLVDKAIVALLSLEGLRTIEVTRLTVSDIDFENRLIWVLGKGKSTKKPIKLFASCAMILQQYIQSMNLPSTVRRSVLLFPDLKTAQIRYRVNKYLKEIGLKRAKLSAHSLRHTTGQILIDKGVEPVWVQRHLRHELFETTQFYIKKKTEREYFHKMPENI